MTEAVSAGRVLSPPTDERQARRPRRVRSLRSLVLGSLALGVLLIVSVTTLLIASTAALVSSVRALASDGRSLESSERAEGELLRYVRTANYRALTGRPAAENDVDEVRARLRSELRAPIELADTDAERAQIAALATQIDRYIDRRELLHAQGEPLGSALIETRADLDAILSTFEALARVYNRELQASEARAAKVAVVANLAAGAVIVLVLAGVVVAGLAFRTQMVRPLRGIVSAIDRFRSGQSAHAPERGPEELRRIAHLLNEATDALAAQKKMQLAFLAGVAHDLKNPLSGLKTSVAALRASEPGLASSGKSARTFALIERQLDRLSRMVGDLVDSARIEAGELELARADVDLRDAAREIVDLYAHVSADHALVVELPDAPVLVHADPLRIEQVVSNLVSNAIKYSPDGGEVRVKVSAGEGEAVLSVSDHGVGIPRDQLEGIFRPFRRGAGASRVAAGAGLGLSVLRRIVEAHDGRVEIESTPGVGSTFRVHLPVAPEAHE